MKALTVSSNGMAGTAAARQSLALKVLLACGIVSSLLYVAATIIGAMRWEGYSPTAQAVSELFSIGAPSRPFIVPLLIAYDVILYAFGVGVFWSAGPKRALRIVAILIIAKEVFGLVATVFTPLHLRGVEGTLSDTFHGIFTLVGVFLCMLPAMGFAAAAFGKRFRIYTIATMLIFVVCAVWSFLDVPRIAANLPTPWVGVRERINIFSYMLWLTVLAITLLRTRAGSLGLKNKELQP